MLDVVVIILSLDLPHSEHTPDGSILSVELIVVKLLPFCVRSMRGKFCFNYVKIFTGLVTDFFRFFDGRSNNS
jgi:uncharacterized membrane protein